VRARNTPVYRLVQRDPEVMSAEPITAHSPSAWSQGICRIGTALPFWGLETPQIGGRVRRLALLDHMVGEAWAYVQGESLKAHATLPI
jgi:hypothetical protein